MSFTLYGLPVSGGIAIGYAHLISHALLEVKQYQIREREIPDELDRLHHALATAALELEALRDEANNAGSPGELSAFIELHAMLLADPDLTASVESLIRDSRCNAEWAMVQQIQVISEQFDAFEDAYLRERKHDVSQVGERVLRVLQNKPRKITSRKASPESELIVVANDLSPADTLQFKHLKVGGFVTEMGGATSHTAIVARSLAIPAVVGMQHVRPIIQDNELLILDGTRGVLIVDPDARVLEEFRLRRAGIEIERNKRLRLKTAHAVTLDDVAIELHANIELPSDAERAKEVGADGIGLFRSEFLFMNRDELPDEEEQYEAYRQVVKTFAGKPVTIRTLDIGADKEARALRSHTGDHVSPNPALGLRAIRFCLTEPQLFLTQLRAILRAAYHGRVRLLIPMLAHTHEILQTLTLIEEAKAQLRESRQKFAEDIEIGGMIEIPAAALAISPFVRNLDFLSIGTNDLIQYTLAIDRTDGAVAHLYDPLHPAVLQLILKTLQAGARSRLPVSVCGEMAGDPKLTRLLLGMGLRQFSMHPAQILEVKQQILKADTTLLAPQVSRLLKLDDSAKIADLMARL